MQFREVTLMKNVYERGSMMDPLGKVENAPLWREVMFEIERYTTT